MVKSGTVELVFTFLGGIVLLCIIAPLAAMVFHTSLGQVTQTFCDKEVADSIILTIVASMAATVCCSLGAVPLAYILARNNFPFKQIINGIIDLPIVIPHSAAGIALLTVLSRGTILGDTADFFGISFVGGIAGIMAGMAFVSIPFLIHAARIGFEAVPQQLQNAAYTLGASPWQVFFTISLPLASRSILSGLILMWARGMSEFGAVLIIAYHPMITPILMFERFNSFGLQYARPVAVTFILICLLFFILFRFVSHRRTYASA